MNRFDPPLQPDEIQHIFPGLADITPLKRGGQGAVFKAYDTSLNTHVVLKVFEPWNVVHRAEREARKLRRVNMPYLAKLYDYGRIDIRGHSCAFTKIEYVTGQDLSSLITTRRRLPALKVRRLLTCIAMAIDALWAVNVVHRDIKPANIVCADDGRFVLIDLGLAKHLDESTLTQTGYVLGTWGFMAPEQVTGRKQLTLRTDLFALGLTAYLCWTGNHPFFFDQPVPSSRPIRIPPEFQREDPRLAEAIQAMLHLDPLYRPRSGSAIIQFLEGDLDVLS